MSEERFRVDLRGMVDILSHHLYSSPRVYLRELIQNAHDAVTARRQVDVDAPRRIDIDVDEAAGTVVVRDRGIGLTEAEMREVLATIGASSKRDDLSRARRQYLGQFGIGLLSCFLVGDVIEVRSRSARVADAPTLTWVGRADGTFVISAADVPLEEPGTEVCVRARPDDLEWVRPPRVRMLAERFAGLLDLPIWISGPGAAELINPGSPPWRASQETARDWCAHELGFTPLAALPIDIPVAGVVGFAFIADTPGRVGNRRGDTVYSAGMFVSDTITHLAPDWAYFVRLAVEAGDLALTASREDLQQGPLVDEVRAAVGAQIREGIDAFASRDPRGFHRFIDVHAKGLLAMGVSDPEMLDLVVQFLPWETSAGSLTLGEIRRRHATVRYTTSEQEFSTFAPLQAAQRALLINGSYVYGREILERVNQRQHRYGRVRAFDRDRFVDGFAAPAPGDSAAQRVEHSARPILADLGITLVLKAFEPTTTPALYLRDAARSRPGADSDRRADEADPWAEFLTEEPPPAGPRLVLNASNETVRALADLSEPGVRSDAVTGLYAIALMASGERLDDEHSVMLDRALRALIAAAVR